MDRKVKENSKNLVCSWTTFAQEMLLRPFFMFYCPFNFLLYNPIHLFKKWIS